jgi:hypothetical protein
MAEHFEQHQRRVKLSAGVAHTLHLVHNLSIDRRVSAGGLLPVHVSYGTLSWQYGNGRRHAYRVDVAQDRGGSFV